MNRFCSFRTASIVALLLVIAVPAGVFAQAAPSTERVHYWNGQMRVEMDVALDELSLTPDVTRVPGVSRGDVPAGMTVRQVGLKGDMLVSLGSRAAGVAGLNAKAVELRARGFRTEAVLYRPGSANRDDSNRSVMGTMFSVKLLDPDGLADVLTRFDVEVVEEISYSEDTYILRVKAGGLLRALDVANALYEGDEAEFATPLLKKQRFTRAAPNDPKFNEQWHLQNTGQVNGAVAGNDVNIVGAWNSVTGNGINIAVTDSGVQVDHPDLLSNVRTDIDLDINGNDNDPSPQSSSHGTSAAGVAAATGNNSTGVAGSGYDAGIVGIRLIEALTTDAEEAEAMGHQVDPASANDRVHINTNSWGPLDDAERKETFGPLAEAAIMDGIANGRGGLGTIYTWAAGNGRGSFDNVNYDGWASSRYTIAVGATGGSGVYSSYSEPGASMLVNAPSSYSGAGVTTTKTGSGYTSGFGGTSSACPLVAGVVALMLEANANLRWRDVQHILVETAEKNDPGNVDWFVNGAGHDFNHAYGFGRVDATAAVSAASTWTNVPEEVTPLNNTESVTVAIPNSPSSINRTLSISAPAGFVTEFVEVTFSATHSYRGDIGVILTSPDGTTSVFAELHDDANSDYSNWLFTSVAHWGEDPNGTWTLNLSDLYPAEDDGTLTSWMLEIHGYIEGVNLHDVYVNFTNNGAEDGSSQNPFDTLAEGLAAVIDSGTIHFQAGSSSETLTINQAVTLQSAGSTVQVGVAP